MVAGHVEHDRHVVALVAEPLAQDPAARHLEDRGVDARVLQHHRRRAGAGGIGLSDEAAVHEDAVGARHADATPHPLEDVGDHPRRRRLAVAAGDGDDRNARRGARREEHVEHRLGHVLGLALGRVGMHPEPRRRVDLHDPATGLPHRLADVGTDEVDPGDVQPHDPRRELGDLRVVRVNLLGAVDADPAGAHVAGALEVDPLAARRHVA